MGAKITTPFRSAKFGARVLKSINTIHQSATAGFICAWAIGLDSNSYISGFTDGSNPPTTIVQKQSGYAGGQAIALSFEVIKEDFFAVVFNNVTDSYLSWVPLENVWRLV